MLKSCSRCGKIHDFNYNCYKNRQIRGKSNADKFRKTYQWHKKSADIRDRDKHLCKVCLANIFNTTMQFNYNSLEVHHIVPLEEDLTLSLDDDNLITLCCYHHKLADKKIIPRYILTELLGDNVDYDEIRRKVEANIPPTF